MAASQAVAPDPESARKRVLRIASRALLKGGPEGLTVRDVASEAGCSTMMIYTLFGGKAQLLESLYLDGFSRLQAALASVAECDPFERLRRLARAYREFGLANRSLYAAMFSRPIAAPTMRGNGARLEDASFGTLVEAVRAARAADAIVAKHAPQTVADALWSVVHGGVSLEISGHFTDDAATAEARFDALIDICLTGPARAFAPRKETVMLFSPYHAVVRAILRRAYADITAGKTETLARRFSADSAPTLRSASPAITRSGATCAGATRSVPGSRASIGYSRICRSRRSRSSSTAARGQRPSPRAFA